MRAMKAAKTIPMFPPGPYIAKTANSSPADPRPAASFARSICAPPVPEHFLRATAALDGPRERPGAFGEVGVEDRRDVADEDPSQRSDLDLGSVHGDEPFLR